MILPFELDPQIIHHIIYSQAGSIGKAIIELLMNSVDARATAVRLFMTKEGFQCGDDGVGFASREDVLRYFGRFGTPHEEGDATYGRFRLGRGQIMAHASTVWTSNQWKMAVDTRTMGYSYDLEDLEAGSPGCQISGVWYEPLADAELMSAIQEVRDLVRYTPVSVELNGRTITRDPKAEKWDFEDEFAYYRVKEEGAVSIYNQGVLVRHDSSHLWGAGGLIVSKKAIGLNVSRTEILRKTCAVWKSIAKQFGKMAEEIATRLGERRKTEARREKYARALLSGDPKIVEIYLKEEVVTVLPGKRHITLSDFFRKIYCHGKFKGSVTVVENGFDVPKGEAIAREGMVLVVHPKTMERFGCYNPEDFRECLDRIIENIRQAVTGGVQLCGASWLRTPEFVAFSTLRDAFVERTMVVSEKNVLDKETRRAWTALRWCIQQYAGACTGGQICRNGRLRYDDDRRMHILLGDSNTAEAWTDGKSYVAIDQKIVQKLKNDPLRTTAYIFGLVEHEVAHQGDSLECGHDEAFYQRYHDISIRMSPERQRYIHMWLMKYTYSMESEGKPKSGGKAWAERFLMDRVGSGRQKRGLQDVIVDVSADPVVTAYVPEENISVIDDINAVLSLSGLCPPPPNWQEVIERARQEQIKAAEKQSEEAAQQAVESAQEEEWFRDCMEDQREQIASILGIAPADISEAALSYMCHYGSDKDRLQQIWENQEWEGGFQTDADYDSSEYDDRLAAINEEALREFEAQDDPRQHLPEKLHSLLQAGETWWGLERNAAAAGFFRVADYLEWRGTNQ